MCIFRFWWKLVYQICVVYIKVLVETDLPYLFIVYIQVLVETGLPDMHSIYPGSGGNWFIISVYGLYPFGNPNLINIQVKTIDTKKFFGIFEMLSTKCCQLNVVN